MTGPTIADLPNGVFAEPAELAKLRDYGSRRYRVFAMDYDSRPFMLSLEITEEWTDQSASLMRSNQQRIIKEYKRQYGLRDFERKLADIKEVGAKPFSIIAHHNRLFEQARVAFIAGAYYAALTAACALGERVLNHLVLDLREDFKATPAYRKVHGKSSFANWGMAIDTLQAWNVLLPKAADEFRALEKLRNHSLHFNPETVTSLKDLALEALKHLHDLIDTQFGGHGTQPWFISGMLGAGFIKREWETDPFVRRYYLRGAPFVGTLHGIEGKLDRPRWVDFRDYGPQLLTDDQYRDAFNNRDPEQLAKSNS